MRSTEFLQAAIDVQTARAAEYDQPGGERSMGRTVEAFNTITGRDLSEAEGWLLLQVLKDVRQWSATAYHHDSALDGVAYSALKAEALSTGFGTITYPVEQVLGFNPADLAGNPQLWQPGDLIRFTGPDCNLFLTGQERVVAQVRENSVLLRVEGCVPHPLSFAFAAENFEWVSRA